MAKWTRGRWFSDEQLNELAAAIRKFFGISGTYFIDVVACFRSNEVWTVDGVKRLVLTIVADDQMIGTDAEYLSDTGRVFVKLKRSVFLDAVAGKTRARMTLAHELGHIVLGHQGRALARLTGANRDTPMSSIVETFERPAKAFASLFLVDRNLAQLCESAEQISRKFGVGEQAAQIVWEKLGKTRNRKKIIDGFIALSNQLSGARPPSSSITNDNAAPSANSNKLSALTESIFRPVCRCVVGRMRPGGGNKMYCEDCGYVGDPPDGDSYGT